MTKVLIENEEYVLYSLYQEACEKLEHLEDVCEWNKDVVENYRMHTHQQSEKIKDLISAINAERLKHPNEVHFAANYCEFCLEDKNLTHKHCCNRDIKKKLSTRNYSEIVKMTIAEMTKSLKKKVSHLQGENNKLLKIRQKNEAKIENHKFIYSSTLTFT